jgi:predicted transposase YdaD
MARHPDNPHDRFFREMASDPALAADLLANFLPADIRDLLDPATIEIQKDSFIDPELRAFYADLLYRVSLAKRPAYVYLLFEHKSFADRNVHSQILKYLPRIWDGHAGSEPPTVIPLLLVHANAPWPYDARFSHVFPREDPALDRFFPDFEVVLVDLHRYSDDEIRGAVWTRAFLLLLKHIRSPDMPERLPEILGLLKGLIQSETGLGHLEAMLRYVARVSEPIRPETLERVVADVAPGPEGEQVMATLAEQWMQEGKQQGKQQGLLEGLLTAIEEGLNVNFGESGLRLLPEIRQIADSDKLHGLLKEVLRGNDLSSIREKLSNSQK